MEAEKAKLAKEKADIAAMKKTMEEERRKLTS